MVYICMTRLGYGANILAVSMVFRQLHYLSLALLLALRRVSTLSVLDLGMASCLLHEASISDYARHFLADSWNPIMVNFLRTAAVST